MYHSVSNRNDYFWSTSPEDFKKQMALLADNHIDVISLDELTRRLAAKELLRGAVVITFDDGYHDFYSDAFPFLQQYQFPSTMYLITGSIHTAKINHAFIPYLTQNEIQELAVSGIVDFGGHTKTHVRLTDLSDTEAFHEINGSKKDVELLIGKPALHFAYPYGGENHRLHKLVKKIGFTSAVSTAENYVTLDSNVHCLPRMEINRDTTIQIFQQIIHGQYRIESTRWNMRRIYAGLDRRRNNMFARAIILLFSRRQKPTLISRTALTAIQLEKKGKRGELSTTSKRKKMVSIGVFGCGRFDLLERTCASLNEYLVRFGSSFAYEVLFFHDGLNPEIEVWAKKNTLFDKIFFNEVNRGISYNINRFWFEESQGTYLLNVEDDWVCEFTDNFILHALDILDEDGHVGIVRLERKYPGDYRAWNEAYKIHERILSADVFETRSLHHRYRVLESQGNGEGIYANSCGLIRYSAVERVGRLCDDSINRRSQEPAYMRKFNQYFEGARGVAQKDSPFLHIGYGRSVEKW